MNVAVRECTAAELPALVQKLDEEFVLRKKRELSLQRRFPYTISVDNLPQIRVAEVGSNLCGAYAVRLFEWATPIQRWRGAMVGMVWVDPAMRQRGIGAALMGSAGQFLRDRKVDFGVLWTGSPAFYARFGWTGSDRGLFAEFVPSSRPAANSLVSVCAAREIEPMWLEAARSRFYSNRVMRGHLDYQTLPLPALEVLCFYVEAAQKCEGYALVGKCCGTGYVYEVGAPVELMRLLWDAVCARFQNLMVNGFEGDTFSEWLAEASQVVWHRQGKAMWLRVSSDAAEANLDAWHVPYFDWI